MTFDIVSSQPLAEQVRRVVREQLAETVVLLNEQFDQDPDGTIHSVRKRLKRLRAVLRLVRDELKGQVYRREDGVLQQSGRVLSGARDAHVLKKTFERVRSATDGRFKPRLLETLGTAIAAQGEAGGLDRETVREVADQLAALELRVETWSLVGAGFGLIEEGLRRVYRDGRQAFERAYEERVAEDFHTWRKRVKDLWHQLELLASLWPEVLVPVTEQAHRLSDYLGDDHDLSVLHDRLAEWMPTHNLAQGEKLLQAIEEMRSQLQIEAAPLGLKLYAETPGAFVRRLRCYWQSHERTPAVVLPSHSA